MTRKPLEIVYKKKCNVNKMVEKIVNEYKDFEIIQRNKNEIQIKVIVRDFKVIEKYFKTNDLKKKKFNGCKCENPVLFYGLEFNLF